MSEEGGEKDFFAEPFWISFGLRRYPRRYSVYRNGLLKKIRRKGNCRTDDDVKLKMN